MKTEKIKALIVSSSSIAIAFVLSFIKLLSLPFGGSITLCSMLFICVIGYMYGLKYGLLSAFVYGILNFIQDPYILSPLQVIIDYGCAFTALGLSGIMKGKKFGLQLGYLIGVTGRFVFSVLSGVVFFADYAPDGMNAFVYSAAYNGCYIYTEAVISLIILSLPPVSKGIQKVIDSSAFEG